MRSPVSDEDSQGVWAPFDRVVTPTRTRLNTSSTLRSGTRRAFNSSSVYRPFAPSPSAATDPGAVAYAISVPRAASTAARPLAAPRSRRSNGLLRHASRITTFTRFLASAICSSRRSTSTAAILVAASESMSASTGTR